MAYIHMLIDPSINSSTHPGHPSIHPPIYTSNNHPSIHIPHTPTHFQNNIDTYIHKRIRNFYYILTSSTTTQCALHIQTNIVNSLVDNITVDVSLLLDSP